MLNQTRLSELRSEVGDDDFHEVVEIFFEEVEEVLAALEADPTADVVGRLHFLKGSVLNLGLDGVGRLCVDEEQRLKADAGHTPDIAGIRGCYEASKAELGVQTR